MISNDKLKTLEWNVNVPILGNRIIGRQLLCVFGIPIIVIFILVTLLNSGDNISYAASNNDVKYASFMIGTLIVLSLLVIFSLYKNRYEVIYKLNDKGITEQYSSVQKRKNRIVNLLLGILSFLSNNHSGMGMSLLANTRQQNFVAWHEIESMKVNKREKVIELKANGQKIVVFCTAEVFRTVISLCEQRININTNI